jgi:flagellar biosynthetic protein FlhB
MADDTQQEERTEQPSEKKLADARRKGRVPRSRELSTTVVMLAAAGSSLAMQPLFSDGLQQITASGLNLSRELIFEPSNMPRLLGQSIGAGMRMLVPLWIVLGVSAVLGSVLFGGWVFSPEAFAPKLEKLNPLKGIKRVFGVNGLVELAKSLGKFLVVAIAASSLLWWLAPQFMGLGTLTVGGAVARAAQLAAQCFVGFAAALLLITAADVPFQYWHHRRQLRMTKQELKDEQKETEGRPEVKSRIRNAQQQIATQRMMAEVPKADVIAMNPTHFAVALRYDAKAMKAPKVVAKGADLVALAIRRVGEAHGVPIFEHPPLARALFHNTRLGQQISPRLYVAVAQVLTYVYQLRNRPAPGAKPARPDIAVDADLLMPDRERRRAARMQQE